MPQRVHFGAVNNVVEKIATVFAFVDANNFTCVTLKDDAEDLDKVKEHEEQHKNLSLAEKVNLKYIAGLTFQAKLFGYHLQCLKPCHPGKTVDLKQYTMRLGIYYVPSDKLPQDWMDPKQTTMDRCFKAKAIDCVNHVCMYWLLRDTAWSLHSCCLIAWFQNASRCHQKKRR